MTNSYKTLVATFIASVLIISSCNLFNPAEPVPAYIHIDKITLIKNPAGFVNTEMTDGSEGTLSGKFSDAWVYVDDQLIGCFELPATFPVLAEGSHLVKIRPGIKVNGIAATRTPYPFLSEYDQTVDFQKGTKTTLTPTTMYLSNTTFKFMENFESAGTMFDEGPGTNDTAIKIVHSPASNVFEGSYSGIINLDKAKGYFECSSHSLYVFPRIQAPVFLEFNYKCNNPFSVGLYAFSNAGTLPITAINMNDSGDWNKAYVYLTPIITETGTATNYKIFLGMENYLNRDSIGVLIDNIRIVY